MAWLPALLRLAAAALSPPQPSLSCPSAQPANCAGSQNLPTGIDAKVLSTENMHCLCNYDASKGACASAKDIVVPRLSPEAKEPPCWRVRCHYLQATIPGS